MQLRIKSSSFIPATWSVRFLEAEDFLKFSYARWRTAPLSRFLIFELEGRAIESDPTVVLGRTLLGWQSDPASMTRVVHLFGGG